MPKTLFSTGSKPIWYFKNCTYFYSFQNWSKIALSPYRWGYGLLFVIVYFWRFFLSDRRGQWRSQCLPGWAICPRGRPKWGKNDQKKKMMKFERIFRKMRKDWGNVLILPKREWETALNAGNAAPQVCICPTHFHRSHSPNYFLALLTQK